MKKTRHTDVTSSRRLGVTSAHNRHALLDAAELIMCEEGYAAVTSRHVANRAGLKPQLVYYYFRTMDDLFLAVFQRRSERNQVQVQELLAVPQPLHTMWEFLSDSSHSALAAEFMALANHRKIIRDELKRQAETLRARQADVFSRILHDRGIDEKRYPPVALAMLFVTVSQVLVRERAFGIEAGHAELNALVDNFLNQLEPQQAPPDT